MAKWRKYFSFLHCRYFPCCDLKDGKGPKTEGIKEIPCDAEINKQFKGKGHFACDDLVKNDPLAQFYFMVRLHEKGQGSAQQKYNDPDQNFACISVCINRAHSQLTASCLLLLPIVIMIYQLLV